MDKNAKIGVLGAGAMGVGIAQIAAQAEHTVSIFDTNAEQIESAKVKLDKVLARLVEKETFDQATADGITERISWISEMQQLSDCSIVIEAIVEDLEIKKEAFKKLEEIVSNNCILATNTSSLSVASIAAACENSARVIGIHFFNPAPVMALVEIIPAVQTDDLVIASAKELMLSWDKVAVVAKDTPGFIVNRVARPFYGEAFRIYEEGYADFATIDWAMKDLGGFNMGPFELMDFLGIDVTYAVTESVFTSFYFDPRYRPSFTHKRHLEAGWLGRKSGHGFYDYEDGAILPEPKKDKEVGEFIVWRILVMLINEAADALNLKIATRNDIDSAMTQGVNYPKGLLKWAHEKGIKNCVYTLDHLHNEYLEDRYRCSPMLRRMAREEKTFY